MNRFKNNFAATYARISLMLILLFGLNHLSAQLNEIKSTVTAFSLQTENGRLQTKQTLSTLPLNFSGKNTAAEISVDAKGKFLYVSNRGDNSIGLFTINSEDGILTNSQTTVTNNP